MSIERSVWWQSPAAKITGLICMIIAILGLMVWWFFFHPFVSTDDARVAATLVRLAPEGVSGRIEKVNVTEGDRVKQGDIIVELDHRNADANLKRARSRSELASSELKRSSALARQSGIARRDLDKAQADAQSLESELKLAELAHENTTIRSPIDGVVVQKLAEVGNILEAGQVAVTIADVDHAWIAANIEETAVGEVKVGQKVMISIDEGGKLTGHVAEVRAATASQFALIPSENAAGNFTKLVQRIPIKIEVDPHKGRVLRPGQSVEIRIRVN